MPLEGPALALTIDQITLIEKLVEATRLEVMDFRLSPSQLATAASVRKAVVAELRQSGIPKGIISAVVKIIREGERGEAIANQARLLVSMMSVVAHRFENSAPPTLDVHIPTSIDLQVFEMADAERWLGDQSWTFAGLVERYLPKLRDQQEAEHKAQTRINRVRERERMAERRKIASQTERWVSLAEAALSVPQTWPNDPDPGPAIIGDRLGSIIDLSSLGPLAARLTFGYCAHCDELFLSFPNRWYCSDACKQDHTRHRRSLTQSWQHHKRFEDRRATNPAYQGRCLTCSKVFRRTKLTQQYCSSACRSKRWRQIRVVHQEQAEAANES